jgi:hypothetical protein
MAWLQNPSVLCAFLKALKFKNAKRLVCEKSQKKCVWCLLVLHVCEGLAFFLLKPFLMLEAIVVYRVQHCCLTEGTET